MTSSMSVSIERKLGCLWITLPDAISMYNSRELEKTISGNLEPKLNVILDLSKTWNLFSSGLGLIIRIRKTVCEQEGVLSLVNVNVKIRDMLNTLNLNKVLSIYATDVEFELSRDELWHKRNGESEIGFLFVAQIEHKIFKINMSGEMVENAKYDLCEQFNPDPTIKLYVFDFSSLELMDQKGAAVFFALTRKISEKNGECHVFGAEEYIQETIRVFGSDQYCSFFDDEKAAIEKCTGCEPS
jgi:anti-anti-sigma factor